MVNEMIYKTKISIIVPVFQAEKYIADCLHSLLNQDLDEYEIICVNDGSTDNSESIIHHFQQKTNKIKYIYQKNQGVSAARNHGIRLAEGKYLMFVDSDDTILSNSLNFLYSTAEKKHCDILAFGGKTDKPLQAPEWMRQALYTKNKDYASFHPDLLLNELGAQPSVCNKLIKKEVMKDFWFSENISIAEDVTFLFLLLPTVKKISFVSKRIYKYRISNSNSAMHQTNEKLSKYMESHITSAELITSYWLRAGLLDDNKSNFVRWLTDFLRAPYNQLDSNLQSAFSKRIENLYASMELENMIIAQSGETTNSLLFFKVFKNAYLDIKKYGLCGGIENLIHKISLRNQ